MGCSGCSINSADNNYPVWRALSLTRGDSFEMTVRVLSEGVPVTLGAEGRVYWQFRKTDGSDLLRKVFTGTSQDGEGYVTLSLLPGDTAEISPGCYEYEIEFCVSPDELVITAVRGVAEICGDIITPDERAAQ